MPYPIDFLKSINLPSLVPRSLKQTATNVWREVGAKVDALYRGIEVYAYKPPANQQAEGYKFLASRDKFINPTFQQFVKTAIFVAAPTGMSVRYLATFALGAYLPISTAIAAITAVFSMGILLGFVRQKIEGNSLEKALATIISLANPSVSFENAIKSLPLAHFGNHQIEMGQNSVGVIKNQKDEPEYVVFRYLEKVEGVNQIHTRIYSIGGNWISTGTTVNQDSVYDVTTSLEGKFIGRLIEAAKNPSFTTPLPPAPPRALVKDSLNGLARLLTPDVARQNLTVLFREIIRNIDTYYLGKSVYSIEKEDSPDQKFLNSRDRFINLTKDQLIRNVGLFGIIPGVAFRYFASLRLGPYIPLVAVVISWLGLCSMRKLVGAFRQYRAGNDLQRALISIVRLGAPNLPNPPQGGTVLDLLPEKILGPEEKTIEMGSDNVGIVKKDGQITHVAFRYIEKNPGPDKVFTRIYYIGTKKWSANTYRIRNVEGEMQLTTSLESKYIDNLINAVREYNKKRIKTAEIHSQIDGPIDELIGSLDPPAEPIAQLV